MTIALRAAGTIVAGTTSAAPAYPAGIGGGDAVFLGATWKLETATAPTISGWTIVVNQTVGSGAAGVGTGAQRIVIWRKDTVAGGESGTVTVTPSGTVNVTEAGIIAFSKTGSSWDITYDYGNDTTAAVNLSCTSQAQIAHAAADLIAFFAGAAANSNMGSSTVATTGVVYGTAVEHSDVGSANGNAIRASWNSRPVTSGTQSAVTTFASTIAVSVTGGVGLVRLRETGMDPRTMIQPNRARLIRASHY